jgi:adenine-specific DNA-methyltransferase
VATDRDAVDVAALEGAVAELNAVPGEPGYVTEVFCEQSRFFQPFNGARIDAVRHVIARDYAGTELEPVLVTSLLEAADRVDSTTGVQMAYVKQWSDRSYRPLELRVPELLSGPGRAVRGDACAVAADLGPFDLAYLDPPYNQHRYEANYHIWETLVAGDEPDHYGVACKRTEVRHGERSAFNSRRTIAGALGQVVRDVRARLVVLSYNDESWIGLEELVEMCAVRGHVEVLGFASNRYVGARIGIHNPAGERVGSVGRLRNLEYVVVAGERDEVRYAVAPWRDSVVVARAS